MAITHSNRKFGISSNLSGLQNGMIVNSISKSENIESAEARDEHGRIIDIAVYGSGEQITLDGLAISGGVKAGDIIQIDDKKYLITAHSGNESNTAFETTSVTARYAPSAYLWPLSATAVTGAIDPSGTIYTEKETE